MAQLHQAALIAAAAIGIALAAGVGGYLGSTRITRAKTTPPNPKRSVADAARARLAEAQRADMGGDLEIDEDAARIFWLHGRLTGYHAGGDA